MLPTWKESVSLALQRYSVRNATVQITRSKFITEEIEHIVAEVGSAGKTPSQTVSRVLQELRDEGFLFFSDKSGEYILNQVQIDASAEDLPEDALENAIDKGILIFKDVEVSSAVSVTRIRTGVGMLRKKTLSNYRNCCALCDIDDMQLLVTSHIDRWTDNPAARGLLSNTICFCTLHDKLFENGYFSMNDDTSLIWRKPQKIKVIETWEKECTGTFKFPRFNNPSPVFMNQHRARVGLSST